MKKIVVTGATSMIGAALVKAATQNGVKVLALVRQGSTRLDRLPNSDLVQIETCNLDELATMTCQDDKFDVFYHFAWNYTGRSERNDPILQARNIQTTLSAVELAARLGCKKFIGAGSQAEYGIVDDVINPETPTRPITSYGIAKLSSGLLAAQLCAKREMTCVWARIFSVYGCYDNEGTMLNYAIDHFLKGEVAEFSAATQQWNYLNERDAGKIFYLLGAKDNTRGVYCVAHPQSRPLRDYILELKDIFGKQAQCSFAKEGTQENVVNLRADTSKLTNDLSFYPEVAFYDGIREVIEYRKNLLRKAAL